MSFFDELKRRNVIRVGIAYAAVAWLLAQIVDLGFGAFAAPDWALRAFLIALLVGFPIALVIAWVYELTPEGVRVDEDGVSDAPAGAERKLDRIIIGFLAAAVTFLLVDKFYLDSVSEPLSSERQSIAVLPFVNMSVDNDNFADGLSEELLNLLAQNLDLNVAGRTSSFAFKGHTGNFTEIGEQLNVEHVLEGSVRRSGDTLRVTAQLIRVENGFHVWSDTFDRQMTDIFEIQDDVAAAISRELRLRLVPESKRVTDNIEAYALYLEAVADTGLNENEQAIEWLLKATALDPEFAKAYEQLSLSYWIAAGATIDPTVAVGLIREAATRALELDPDLIIANVLFTSTEDRDEIWADYLMTLERAVKAEPNSVRILEMMSQSLLSAGYFREALTYNDRVLALDPLSARSYFTRGLILSASGQREATREAYLRTVELGLPGAYGSISFDYFVAGEYEEGIRYEEIFREVVGEDPAGVRAEVESALDPVAGKEFLDRLIASRIDTHPFPAAAQRENLWYLAFGYLDAYWDKIEELNAAADTAWTHAGTLVYAGIAWPLSGFREHPAYVTEARAALWDERGAPDTCSKESGEWVCW